MRYRLLTHGVVLVVAAGLGPGCAETVSQPHTALTTAREAKVDDVAEEPLLLEDEAPLLLEQGEEEFLPAGGGGADNSRCFVCHINYVQEELALVHARADVGCADCHGESDDHIADESWAEGGNGTAPDIMYPREKINPACVRCHPREKIDTKQHERLFAGTSEKKYCTDCHGKHRLPSRRCKWK